MYYDKKKYGRRKSIASVSIRLMCRLYCICIRLVAQKQMYCVNGTEKHCKRVLGNTEFIALLIKAAREWSIWLVTVTQLPAGIHTTVTLKYD